MPGIDEEMLAIGGMAADYNALQREISGLNPMLRRRRDVRVTSPAGTDVKFRTGARWVLEDNGICNRPGQIANLPAGKVFVLPKEGSMNGKVVIDGLLHGILSEVIKNRRSDQRDDLREGLEKAVQVAAHPQRLLEDFDSLEFDWTPPSRTGFEASEAA